MFTGLSGSGKSSLAFDTIYAEGQRRYVESLSSYARQFLGQMEKPDVDFIEGLSPAISIDQKSTSQNPRSTVGTITEIYDYLRLLYARIGKPHCPKCGRPIERQTADQIVDQILQLPEGTRFQVLAPIIRGRKGEYERCCRTWPARASPGLESTARSASCREDPAGPVLQARHRGRRRPPGREARHPPSRGRLDRDRAGALRGRDRRRSPSRRHDGAEEILQFSQQFACVYDGLVLRGARARGTSRSTRRTAPARPATGWAPASRSTRT